MARRRSMGWRRFVARHHRAPWARALAKAARTYLHAWQNLDYDGAHNGERWLLEHLEVPPGAVVLDVGANVGEWAAAARAAHPLAVVHAFEIVPDTAAALAAGVGCDPHVVVHPYGLGAVDAEVPVWVPARSDRGASTVRSEVLGRDGHEVGGRTRRGDDVLAELGDPPVALCKIDVEGAGVAVLDGLERSLASGRVAAVQLEWNEWAVEAGTSLRDHHRRLEGAGFVVGRLHPDGVRFAPYRPALERDAPGHYVAVRGDRPDLVARLACR